MVPFVSAHTGDVARPFRGVRHFARSIFVIGTRLYVTSVSLLGKPQKQNELRRRRAR